MTWIRVMPFDGDPQLQKARDALRELYPIEYSQPTHPQHPQTEGIVASHSLFPDVQYHAFAAFGALMSPDLPLTRRQHEMITTVVSATNRCQYWLESHAEFLRRVTLDEAFVEALKADFRSVALADQDRVMLEYVEQITKDATRISPAFHDRLRVVGFDDRGILQITLIASWFNYINRVADALGVGRGPAVPPDPPGK